LTEQKFNAGDENRLNLIRRRIEMVQLRANLKRIETESLIKLVSLYKALGGGWTSKDIK
tara:strand:+ start:792 stop:968 length:177 start_codon:yes stop_codon:yes gene_type:complete